MNFKPEPGEIEFDFPLLAEDTTEALEEQHARARTDYETWKRDLMVWLKQEGKNPDRLEGYSDSALRQTNYKIDQVMRWLWNQRGYTTELTAEDADKLMKEMGKYSEYGEANLNTFVKNIKRVFKYCNHEKGKSIEWDNTVTINEQKVTNRDYFYKQEFRQLYEASLEYGSVRSYHSCTTEERDELKAHLAQRFEKEKETVTPEDFKRANSFKIVSMLSLTLDMGLRPIEVGRAKVDWINWKDETLDIPEGESSKNQENWKCVLSNRSVRALEKWVEERNSYEKYDGRDELWLTKKGNPYSSNSVNYILDDVMEEAGIEPAGRELSWYSIRHGVATIWADEENIQDAQEQLRHKKVETTLGYSNSHHGNRHNVINSKW